MEIPMIDFKAINGEKRAETVALLHQACEKWGCFMVENHEIDGSLMEKVKQLINKHYEENLKESFYKYEIAKSLVKQHNTTDIDKSHLQMRFMMFCHPIFTATFQWF